jgi:hypothetical protein
MIRRMARRISKRTSKPKPTAAERAARKALRASKLAAERPCEDPSALMWIRNQRRKDARALVAYVNDAVDALCHHAAPNDTPVRTLDYAIRRLEEFAETVKAAHTRTMKSAAKQR